MFAQKVHVQAPNGEMVEIEIHHDRGLEMHTSFLVVACGWLEHFKNTPPHNTKFDGHFINNVIVRKANFPWAYQLKPSYWVFSGFTTFEHEAPIIIIHEGMIHQAELGTLMHELMHVFYNNNMRVRNPKNEYLVQEKAIENLLKILKNYIWITHSNNEPIFNAHGTSRKVLSFDNIQKARAYLRYGMGLHFYKAYQRTL